MPRNIEGLQRSAKLRSKAAVERANTAIRQMQAEEAPINFRTVAALAGVSTAWLYNTTPLRDRIMKLRVATKTPVQNESTNRRFLSQERVITTLRLRIRQLEAKNEDLKEHLERVYGQLATHSMNAKSARQGHIRDVQISKKRSLVSNR